MATTYDTRPTTLFAAMAAEHPEMAALVELLVEGVIDVLVDARRPGPKRCVEGAVDLDALDASLAYFSEATTRLV